MLQTIAGLLSVSVDALIGEEAKTDHGKRGPTPTRLVQQIE